MVLSAQALRDRTRSEFVELKRDVRMLRKAGVLHCMLVPVWSTKTLSVKYLRGQRQSCRWDAELDAAGWPKRLDQSQYKNWGGRYPNELIVHAQRAIDVNGRRLPVAYAVETRVEMHNPLCNVSLLASRGFTTVLGWFRVVDTDSDSKNALREHTLLPLSSKTLLPPPVGWMVVAL